MSFAPRPAQKLLLAAAIATLGVAGPTPTVSAAVPTTTFPATKPAAGGGKATAAKPQPKRAVKLQRAEVVLGAPDRMKLTGRVVGPATRLIVTLERRDASRWIPAASKPVSRPGSITVSVAAAAIPAWPATVRLSIRKRGATTITAASRSTTLARKRIFQTEPHAASAPATPVAAVPTQVPALPAPEPTPTPTPAGTPTPTPTPRPTGTLPLLTLAVDGGTEITSKETYVGATISVGGLTARTEIKGRGNSTWLMPKRPYRLKLETKASLLGMPSSRHWVLLADYADPSLLRNELAFRLGSTTLLAWTPRQQAVEVMFNGAYAGVYHLTEQIRVDPARVAIKTTKDPATTGYLLEREAFLTSEPAIDCTAEGLGSRPPGFTTPATPGSGGGQTPILVHDPECHTLEQLTAISAEVEQFERALYGPAFADPSTGYARYVDVPSFVDWAIAQEVTCNIDAWAKSVWFFRPAGGKFTMGPLWDFDVAFASPYVVDAGWLPAPTPPAGPCQALAGTGWLARMFADPAFDALAAERWGELRGDVLDLRTFLAARATALRPAAEMNAQLWPRPTSFDAELRTLDDWLVARVAWLDTRFGTTPAAP